MRYFPLFSLFLLFQTASAALPVETPETDTDLTRSQIRQQMQDAHRPQPVPQTAAPPVSMTEEELLANPALLQSALDTAVAQQHTGNIRFLLPLYRRLPENRRDPVLDGFAETFVLRADGKHAQAEQKLRALLAKNPEYAPVRLQLALTLSQDGQTREAAQEIAALRQTPDLPPDISAYLDSFSRYLKHERAWSLSGNAYYIADSNVNRAPEQRRYGNWRFPEPKSAHGIGYEFSAQKTVPVKKHWAARVQASVNGKFYWDAHDYDDLNVRLEAGPTYRTAQSEISLSPFAEQRWYGTERYAHTLGGVLRYSHTLSPKHTLFGALQSGYRKHRTRRHLNGSVHNASLSLVYQTSPQQYFVFGTGGGAENTRDLSDAYRYGSLRAGWTRQWQGGKGLATSLNGSVQHRRYRGEDLFNIRRRDTEYFLHVSAGHKKLSWKGLTPRLNWTWTYTDSNHFYYRRHDRRLFLDVSKQF